MRTGLIVCALLALPLHAAAQSGELWEITTQMPGMPAGMMKPQRVCQGDDPERARAAQKDQEQCKVTDKKQTATRTQVTMVCKSGTMTIDQQYNAGRTEFKSTMTMKSKDGDFTMNMTGRKVGACDAVATRKEQDAKVDAMKKQAAAGAAAGAAAVKETSDKQIKDCTVAAENMQYTGLGIAGQCYAKKNDKQCQQIAQAYPEVSKVCGARVAEFCKRLQTPAGFMKASGRENAAQMCGVSVAAIKAAHCPKGARIDSLAFLGAYCPVEAKPIAQEHCAGRDYTSKMGGKYGAFCENYLANNEFEQPRGAGAAPASAAKSSAGTSQAPTAGAPADQGQQNVDQIKQGVSKGLDKLKGLFGR
jgi:hypothetical protein